MKDIIDSLIEWKKAGKQAALATVLQTWGSSPRQPGAHMAIENEGEFIGSVSGGCVETAVVQEASEVIKTGKSKRIKYGVADETAWEVGLACGGEIEVFISPISWEDISPLAENLTAQEPLIYQIELNELGTISPFTENIHFENFPYLDQKSSPEKFILFAPSDPTLVIVGGVNIAQNLVGFSKILGYKTILIDPRSSFANPKRFPQVDRIINAWPEDAFEMINITTNTAIVILTHDDKIDIPAIMLSINSPAFYIGALGSKKTQSRRNSALMEMGASTNKLERIHGPIGLDIGAKNPLEIALAIITEITFVSNKKISNN